MSLMSGAELVPIGIKPSKNYRPFTKVTINIGKPMDISEYKDKKGDKEALDFLSKKLMNAMIELTKV